MIIHEPNTKFYDYTEEELNDFEEYKKDFRKNVNSYNRRMSK